MFIINTAPLGNDKTIEEYAMFLVHHFILTQFNKGATEVHIEIYILSSPGDAEISVNLMAQA